LMMAADRLVPCRPLAKQIC